MKRKSDRTGRNAREVRATLDAFRHIFQAVRGGSHRRRGSIGGARLFALQQIADHPDASVNDIAARTFTHQSSVSVVIQRLVATGLVVKAPAQDDARRTRLSVTAKGKRALAGAPGTVQEDLVSAVSSLSAGDRRTLARLMTAIARAVTRVGTLKPPPMFFEEHEQ